MSTANKILMGASGAGGPVGPSDDEFNRVSFLSHFDGANNGVNNAFDDGSSSNHTITANGNVTQGSFGPFARPDGEWGVDTSGGWTYWGYNVASTGALGDEDFCMECFVFINSFAAKQGIASRNFSGTAISNETWRWEVQTNGTMTMISKNFFGQDAAGLTSSTALTLNTWHHIAAVRQNDTLTFYIDGTARGATSSGSGVFSASDSMWNIGSNGYQTSTSTSLQGTMSNFRLVVGSAVYTGNFTAPSSKLTAITNTEMLTYQSNRFVDNSADGNSLATVSSPAVTAFGPFLTSSVYDPAVNGASAYIAAGDSDYLSMPAQTIPTGNFTVEGWYYLDGTQSNSTIIAQGSSGNAARTFVGIEAVGGVQSLRFQMGSSLVTPNFAAIPNQWTHFCATYNGSAMKLFQNGVSGGTTSRSGDAENVAMVIGRLNTNWANSYGVKGYISDIRVSSVVRQSSNFTPPTAPLTNVDSNVKFLANMADGQAIDSAAQNNLTLAGNAKISTSVKKFGATSLFLDGGTSECFARYPQQGGGTGDFTIEFWIYGIFNNDQVKTILDGRSSGDTSHFMLAQEENNTWNVLNSAGGTVASGWDANTFSNNTWTHVAISRANGTTKYFIDGTQTASVSDTSNWVAGDFTIGGRYTPSATNVSHNGYIDDFRVSMMARYTSNFTPATEPFADKGR